MHPSPKHSVRDPSVTFEEYVYWAKLTRTEESTVNQAYLEARKSGKISDRLTVHRLNEKHDLPSKQPVQVEGQAMAVPGDGDTAMMSRATQQDWAQAERALRTTSWGAVFFLITTDILGPMTTPWAFAQTGYGPGVALYTVFGALAA